MKKNKLNNVNRLSTKVDFGTDNASCSKKIKLEGEMKILMQSCKDMIEKTREMIAEFY